MRQISDSCLELVLFKQNASIFLFVLVWFEFFCDKDEQCFGKLVLTIMLALQLGFVRT